jgi:hypothetical protein
MNTQPENVTDFLTGRVSSVKGDLSNNCGIKRNEKIRAQPSNSVDPNEMYFSNSRSRK